MIGIAELYIIKIMIKNHIKYDIMKVTVSLYHIYSILKFLLNLNSIYIILPYSLIIFKIDGIYVGQVQRYLHLEKLALLAVGLWTQR